MRRIPLSQVKDNLSEYLKSAGTDEIIITRHGKPAGVLIGFDTEDDWIEYRLIHDPNFLARIDAARESIKSGAGVMLEDLPK